MEISADAAAALHAEVVATCEREGWPSANAAVVAGGGCVHHAAAGTIDSGDAPLVDTVYRIASMTKSFTAATVLSLRDEGSLRLDDPIAEHVPELAGLRAPEQDSPAITIRHLLTMSGGMSTDDSWGDRQLDIDADALNGLFRAGATFAHTTGVAMQYSNYGYAMLGRLIENVTGEPYDSVVTERLLAPLKMTRTAFRQSDLPADSVIAFPHHRVGEELVRDNSGLLAHGGFGAMGGLWSTLSDLARWVHFLADAFPGRSDDDASPLSQASRREMQQVHRAYEPPDVRLSDDGKVRVVDVGYGMGLEIFSHTKLGKVPTHSGGLPGYGSNMRWSTDRGVGVVTLANVTYANARALADRLLEILVAHDALPAKKLMPTPLLDAAFAGLVGQLNDWDDDRSAQLFAVNVDPDESLTRRRDAAAKLVSENGRLSMESIEPMSATEGDAIVVSDNGARFTLEVQLTPTIPSTIQYYRVVSQPAPAPEVPA
jgi:CubicO group peptidase (beta-lactamase class C family)